MTSYGEAVGEAIALELPAAALMRLAQLADIFSRKPIDATVVGAGLNALLGRLGAIDGAIGPGAIEPLQAIYKRGTRAFVLEGSFNRVLMSLLWQSAKGLQTTELLRMNPPPMLDSHAAFATELADIESTRAWLNARTDDPDPEALGVDEELLLAAYTRPTTVASGSDPATMLRNNQHALDAKLERALVARLGPARTHVKPEVIQAFLPEDTVLLDTYVGVTDHVAVHHMFLTHEGVAFAATETELIDGVRTVPAAGREVVITQLAALTAQLRRELLIGADDEQVTERALGMLRDHERLLFGPTALSLLEELRRAGKRHLCIVPQGPLRYYPWHLLGGVSSPLGARFTVSYLPTLAGLIEMHVPDGPPRTGVASFGLDFAGDPRGWDELPRTVEEAERVAEAMGGRARINREATKAAVLDALGEARWVHLASHGIHDAGAPAFQRIILDGPAGAEGELAAHELLALDLRGLEGVSLSACETALGRFDEADNVRGLPASLMLAGAAGIVGTLWPVRDDTSADFFEGFYRSLAGGASAREAFAQTQDAIRASYPNHADWGAFYAMGHVLFPPGPGQPAAAG